MIEIFITTLLIFAVIMVFNFVIFIHELGHFWAARWRGMYVDRFQIWFGKPIWKKKIGEVQYGIGWIPFGGFVSLPQMADMEGIEGQVPDHLKGKIGPVKPIDKIIVAAAGPLFSFLLAVVAALVVWLVGVPANSYETTTVGHVSESAPAYGKLKRGDKILEIEGESVNYWFGNPPQDSVAFNIAVSGGETVDFLVERDGEKVEVQTGFTIPEKSALKRKGHRQVGIDPERDVVVGSMMKYSPAVKAGLKEGDTVVEVDGVKVWSRGHFIDLLKDKDEVRLKIDREGEQMELVAVLEQPVGWDEKKLGMGFGDASKFLEFADELVYKDPLSQIRNHLDLMWISISKVASTDNDIDASQLNGPVGIAMAYYDMLRSKYGWRLILSFTVLLNVNLAILNLLPLPVLDGGHITMSFYEMVRKKPMPPRFVGAIQSVFVLLLLGFMLFITSKDTFDRWLKDKPEGLEKQKEMRFKGP